MPTKLSPAAVTATTPPTIDHSDVVDDAGQPVSAAAHDVVDDNGQPMVQAFHYGKPVMIPKPQHSSLLPPDIFPDLGEGIKKGALSTGTGALKIGRGAATGNFGPFDQPGTEEEIYKPLEAEGFLQHVGKGIEQTAEAFIPGSMVEKSIAATKGLPTALRIGDAMWKEALAQGGTAFVQTGGDSKAAAVAGAFGGLVRGAGSTPLFLRDAKLAKEVLDEAQRFGIPLTKAEQTQSSIRKLVDFMVSKTTGGAKTMASFKVERNSMLENVARTIADSVDPNQMDKRSMGVFIQDRLDQVRQVATNELRTATDGILTKASKAQLDLGKLDPATGKYAPSKLVDATREVIADRKYRELDDFLGGAGGNTDNVNEAYRLLETVANPIKEIPPDPVTLALNPNAEGQKVLKKLDVGTARELRTLLFDKSAFADTTTGKASIQRLNSALHDELISTLDRNGMSTEARAFETASGQYKQTLSKLESRVIAHLSKKGDMGAQQVVPETIAEVLRGSTSESTAKELSGILTTDQMKSVRASLLKQTIEDTQHPMGYWDAQKFKREIDELGDANGAALYGKPLYEELKALAKAGERYRILPTTKSIAQGEQLPFMSQVSLAGTRNAATGVAVGAITGSAKGGVATVAALMAAEAGGLVTSSVLARMLTRPSVVNDLTKAITADPMSTIGKQLAARIAAHVASATMEEQQFQNRQASAEMHRKFKAPPKLDLSAAGTSPPPPPSVLPEPSEPPR